MPFYQPYLDLELSRGRSATRSDSTPSSRSSSTSSSCSESTCSDSSSCSSSPSSRSSSPETAHKKHHGHHHKKHHGHHHKKHHHKKHHKKGKKEKKDKKDKKDKKEKKEKKGDGEAPEIEVVSTKDSNGDVSSKDHWRHHSREHHHERHHSREHHHHREHHHGGHHHKWEHHHKEHHHHQEHHHHERWQHHRAGHHKDIEGGDDEASGPPKDFDGDLFEFVSQRLADANNNGDWFDGDSYLIKYAATKQYLAVCDGIVKLSERDDHWTFKDGCLKHESGKYLSYDFCGNMTLTEEPRAWTEIGNGEMPFNVKHPYTDLYVVPNTSGEVEMSHIAPLGYNGWKWEECSC